MSEMIHKQNLIFKAMMDKYICMLYSLLPVKVWVFTTITSFNFY